MAGSVIGNDAEQIRALHASEIGSPRCEVVEVGGPPPVVQVSGDVEREILTPTDDAHPLAAHLVSDNLRVTEPPGIIDLLIRRCIISIRVRNDWFGEHRKAAPAIR